MGIFEKYRHERDEQKARWLFQVTEHYGELWITHAGEPVCPCSMLKDEPVKAVTKIRELYLNNGNINGE